MIGLGQRDEAVIHKIIALDYITPLFYATPTKSEMTRLYRRVQFSLQQWAPRGDIWRHPFYAADTAPSQFP